jgi:hypothetical protein
VARRTGSRLTRSKFVLKIRWRSGQRALPSPDGRSSSRLKSRLLSARFSFWAYFPSYGTSVLIALSE